MDRLQNHYDSAPSKTDAKASSMAGFDDEFTDIVDYILRITYRIWEGKQIGLCYDYYSVTARCIQWPALRLAPKKLPKIR